MAGADTIQLIVTFLHLNTLTFVFNLISIIYFQLNALRFEFCLKLCQARGTDTHTHTRTRHEARFQRCCHKLLPYIVCTQYCVTQSGKYCVNHFLWLPLITGRRGGALNNHGRLSVTPKTSTQVFLRVAIMVCRGSG